MLFVALLLGEYNVCKKGIESDDKIIGIHCQGDLGYLRKIKI